MMVSQNTKKDTSEEKLVNSDQNIGFKNDNVPGNTEEEILQG